MTTRSLASLLFLAAAACTGGTDYQPWEDPGTAEDFLDYDRMPEIELELDDASVQALEANPREYVPGYILYQGEKYGPVGVRVKGQNSFQPFSEKPSLRINVNEYVENQTMFGLKDITLNNMSTDWSQMHERLAYLVARESGLPASRANHALLTVNGEFYGLYSNVETVKPRMLADHFDDNNGTLFKVQDVDFAPEYVDLYEVSDGPGDRTLLNGLAQALTNPDPEAALEEASRFIDLAHFQRYWAMASVIGQFDAFPYSFPGDDVFLYADPSTQKLWIIPWGMDETFFAGDFSVVQTQSKLAAACKAVPSCYQGYVDQTWEILAMTEEMGLDAERARVEAQIAPYVQQDARKPFSGADITEGQLQMGYFIRGRRQMLEMFFAQAEQQEPAGGGDDGGGGGLPDWDGPGGGH